MSRPPAKKDNTATKMYIAAAAILAVAGVGYALFAPSAPSSLVAQETAKSDAAAPASGLMEKGPLDENVMGAENAPVTIVEYSSMTCGHCATLHKNILPKLKEKYIDTGKVRYIIREFPLDDLAAGASMLARCVGPVRYFSFVDVLYARQEDWAFKTQAPLPELLKLAKQAGMTEDAFNKCLSDQKLLDGVNAVRDRGSQKFGVRSTPTLFINGQMLKGANTLEQVEKLMEPHLKTAS